MCYCPTPTLHLNLALTGDILHFYNFKKTFSLFLNYSTISGLSGGFICEFLQFCYCLFGCWWSDKDTDCTCCVDCILKTLHRSNQKNLSFPEIYDMFRFFLLLFLYLTNFTPCGGSVPSAVHWNCNRLWDCNFQLYCISSYRALMRQAPNSSRDPTVFV